jgi:hypothetical protein
VDSIFGGTTPKEVTQQNTGANDVRQAEAFKLSYLIASDYDDRDDLSEYELEVEDFVDDFNDNAKYIEIFPFTTRSISRAISNTIG